MSKISGSCLCGAVSFEVKDDFRRLNFCHCKQCQRATGSAHASNLFTDADNIRWLSGEHLVKRFDVPGRAISKAFCTECGSGLPYISRSSGSLVVPAGALDTFFDSKPDMRNIFWAERAGWYEPALAADRHDAFPA